MDDVFEFRNQLVERYSNFSRSFVRIAARDIREEVERQYQDGRSWPEPLVQINPNYRRKGILWVLLGNVASVCGESVQYIVTTPTEPIEKFKPFERLRLSSGSDDGLLFRRRVGVTQAPLMQTACALS